MISARTSRRSRRPSEYQNRRPDCQAKGKERDPDKKGIVEGTGPFKQDAQDMDYNQACEEKAGNDREGPLALHRSGVHGFEQALEQPTAIGSAMGLLNNTLGMRH